MLCQIKNLMIATHNKATKAIIPDARVNKAGKVAKQAQGAVIQETRDSRAEQIGAISKVNRVSTGQQGGMSDRDRQGQQGNMTDRDRQQGQQEKTSSMQGCFIL